LSASIPQPILATPILHFLNFRKGEGEGEVARRRISCSSIKSFVNIDTPTYTGHPHITLFPFLKRRRRRRSCSSLGFIDPYLPYTTTPRLHFLNFRKGEGEGEVARRRRSCSSLGFIDPYLPSIPTPSLHFFHFQKGEGEGEVGVHL
jgi:hypothetical protein